MEPSLSPPCTFLKKTPSLLLTSFLAAILCFSLLCDVSAQDSSSKTLRNIHYYSDSSCRSDSYMNERCLLDIYIPHDNKPFSTIIWIHGGGLSTGDKGIPQVLTNNGICIVSIDYRLYPRVNGTTCIADAAAAVAWVFRNIEQLGGDTSLVFLSGHSAGGYLTLMLGLDKSWLKPHHIDPNRLAGLIPMSAQAITHFVFREEQGYSKTQPLIDSLAPLFHVRSDAPPLVLITGDRELEMLGRYEENAYLARMMKVTGHSKTTLYELGGFGHNTYDVAAPLLIETVLKISQQKNTHQNNSKK